MTTRREFLLAGCCALIAQRALSAETAAAAGFVSAIYDAYKGKNAHGLILDNERTLRHYFEPALAALIRQDQRQAAHRGELPKLDGDPFVDAQDWDIAAFDIVVSDVGPDRASAAVKFDNAGTPVTVVLDLTKLKSGWRISDITWLREGKPLTLRALLAR